MCFVRIPYELELREGNVPWVNNVNVNNYSDELDDEVRFTSSFPTYENFASSNNNVYAAFSPSQVASVPEPTTYIMFLFGLLFICTAYRHAVINTQNWITSPNENGHWIIVVNI